MDVVCIVPRVTSLFLSRCHTLLKNTKSKKYGSNMCCRHLLTIILTADINVINSFMLCLVNKVAPSYSDIFKY